MITDWVTTQKGAVECDNNILCVLLNTCTCFVVWTHRRVFIAGQSTAAAGQRSNNAGPWKERTRESVVVQHSSWHNTSSYWKIEFWREIKYWLVVFVSVCFSQSDKKFHLVFTLSHLPHFLPVARIHLHFAAFQCLLFLTYSLIISPNIFDNTLDYI